MYPCIAAHLRGPRDALGAPRAAAAGAGRGDGHARRGGGRHRPWCSPGPANPGELSGTAQLVNFAYPSADCVLLTVALVGAAVAGWRAGRCGALLAGGDPHARRRRHPLGDSRPPTGTWAARHGLQRGLPAVAWRPSPRGVRARAARPPRPASPHARRALVAAARRARAAGRQRVGQRPRRLGRARRPRPAGRGPPHRRSRSPPACASRSPPPANASWSRTSARRSPSGELDLHFQPLVDARTGAVHGAEALLRWKRDGPRRRPTSSCPPSSAATLMAPLTDYVLDRALAGPPRWHAAGQTLGVSVNLATANLSEPDLPGARDRRAAAPRRPPVARSRSRSPRPPRSRTARWPIRCSPRWTRPASACRSTTSAPATPRWRGSRASRSARSRSTAPSCARCTAPSCRSSATTIELAHALGLRVVAEGIEDEGTLLALRELGCDLAQGYHLSRPLPAAGLRRPGSRSAAPREERTERARGAHPASGRARRLACAHVAYGAVVLSVKVSVLP